MQTKISGIKAAHLEAAGQGALSLEGKAVIFRGNDGLVVRWSLPTPKEAATNLKIFRTALKYDMAHV